MSLLVSYPFEAKDYSMIGRIGRGAFSNVWKAEVNVVNEDNKIQIVSIKVMDLENISTSFEDILQEVQTMRLCLHENVLKCYCSFVEKDQLWLVTQLMDKGSCQRVMQISKLSGLGEGMNEECLSYILQQSLRGLEYLHENGHIHRDIKCGNILLDAKGGVRLADFGVSGWTISRGQRNDTVRTFVGTPAWMAPEVLQQEGYDNRADIWSIGITALEMAKGHAPYAHYPPMRVLVLTIEDEPPSLKTYSDSRQKNGKPFSKLFEDFCKSCLQKSSRLRPSTSELLRHSIFDGCGPDYLVNELLAKVPSIGDDIDCPDISGSHHTYLEDQIMPEESNPPGLNSGAGIESAANNSTSAGGFDDESHTLERKYVAGTTWVFDSDGLNGSNIINKAHISKPAEGQANSRESLEGFFSDFESELLSCRSPGLPTAVNSVCADAEVACKHEVVQGESNGPSTSAVSNSYMDEFDEFDVQET